MNNLNVLLNLLASGNPQQVIQSNPQFNAVLNQAKQSGSIKNYVMQYAKQNNIDIQPMLDILAKRGFKF